MTDNSVNTALEQKSAAPSVLRWAIGSSHGPRSSAWRLWGNKKGDIYIAVRCLGSTTKASFHRDGNCQVGFTDNYAATASRRFAVKSRHWEKWRLPADQIVRVLQVLVPYSELRPFTDRNDRDITWLPLPPEGSVAVVSIFISAQGADFSLPTSAHATSIVGNVRTSIRTAWIVYAHNSLDAVMAKLINDERAKLKQILGVASWPLNTRAALWESREDHDRHVLELACH
jgi:hypothetical protein